MKIFGSDIYRAMKISRESYTKRSDTRLICTMRFFLFSAEGIPVATHQDRKEKETRSNYSAVLCVFIFNIIKL